MSTGSGAMHCAHCGRPAATLVWLNGVGYHFECTQPPAADWPKYGPPPIDYEARVREIVREELAKANPPAGWWRG